MHVAVNGWFWRQPATGSGRYTRRVVQALAAAAPTLSVSVLLPSEQQDIEAGQPLPLASSGRPRTSNVTLIAGRRRPPATASDLGKVWWEQVTVPTLARRIGADLLHVPYWAPPMVTPTPIVVTIHDIIPRVLPAYRGSWRVRLYTALVSATALMAQQILTDSEAARRDILHQLRIPESRVRAIPLAADDAYTPEPDAEEVALRAQLDLPPAYILYLGGFDVRKNLHTVFSAFKIVHQAQPDATLVIGGRLPQQDTAFTPDPRRLAREASLDAASVQFLGFVPEAATPALYRGARLVIWPTTYEGFGLPALEALSCGTPVVGSDTTSLPEIVGDAGILLPPEDAEGMAGAMLHLWIDDGYHQKLQERARRRAQAFSWARTARETLNAYRDAVGKR